MSAPLSRSSAKAWTLVAQGAGAVALLAGAALFVLAPGETTDPDARLDPIGQLDAKVAERRAALLANEGSGDSGQAPDLASIAYQLAMLPNAPQPEPEVEVPVEEETPVDDATQNSNENILAQRFEYLGAIELKSPTGEIRRVAMVRFREDDEQRLVRAGGSLDNDIMVAEVGPNEIVLELHGERSTITLTDRTPSSVTVANGTQPTPAGVAANPAGNPFSSSNRQLDESGELMRQQALERLRQRGVSTGNTPQNRLGVQVAEPFAPQGEEQIQAFRERQRAIRRGEDPENDNR